MGDPAGIGPEVIAKALAGREVQRLCLPLVIGSVPVMERTVKSLRLKLNVVPVHGHDPVSLKGNTVAVLDPMETPLKKFTAGVAAAETGAASIEFIKKVLIVIDMT